MVFHVLYLKMMLFVCPENCKKGLSFSPFTRFWAYNEADEPHFSALYTPKLHLCTLVLMPGAPFLIPQNPIWDVPFCLLGYPISSFGVSHFAIWGIFSPHLRTMYSPIFGLSSSFSLPKFVCFLSFRFIMFLRNSFGWISQFL